MICGTRKDPQGLVDSKVDLQDIHDLVQKIKDLNQEMVYRTFCINVSIKGIEEGQLVRELLVSQLENLTVSL